MEAETGSSKCMSTARRKDQCALNSDLHMCYLAICMFLCCYSLLS